MAISTSNSASGVSPDAVYTSRIRADIAKEVQLDSLTENFRFQNEQIDHLLEAPDFDLVSAILILGHLVMMQTNVITASQATDVKDKLDRLMMLRRETNKFHAVLSDYRSDAEKFLVRNTVSDLEKDNYSFGTDKVTNFIREMKNFFTDQTAKIEKAEKNFLDSVGNYFVNTGMDSILDQLSTVGNLVDSIDASELPSFGSAADAFKAIERFAANLILGDAVGVTLPGTGELVEGLYSMQSALTEVIANIAEAADHTVSSVLERENDLLKIDTKILTDFLDSSMNQFNTIYQIIRLYYEGLLDIATRLKV